MGTVVAGDGTYGSGASQFSTIRDIFLDQNDVLYVVDGNNQRVQQWMKNSSYGITIAGITGIGGLNSSLLYNPNSIYIDSQQNMYIWNTGYNRLVKCPVSTSICESISAIDYFTYGEDLYVDRDGYVYISTTYNSSVFKYNPFNRTRIKVAAGNSNGFSSHQLNRPTSITVDPDSAIIYIANTNAHTIVSWPSGASSGTIIVGWNATAGSTQSMLRNPQGIVRDKYGNIYVSDTGNNRVLFFCQNPPSTIGRIIAGANLYQPTQIALDSQMNVYVAQPGNYNVQKFARLQ